MITINRIKIKHFRAYEDVDISFRSKNGVILMSGDNGAGKSTLLNAICWCLYADTPFFAIEDSKEVVNKHAPDNAHAEVELTTNIEGKTYVFKRRAARGASGGILTASYEDGGDWTPLEGISAQDAVKRLLPKDIRHLFFFNGEQIKGIFKPGEDTDLKTSIKKVSEIDIIDKAKAHLNSVQDFFLKEISKSNKSSNEIEHTQRRIDELKNSISRHQGAIDIYNIKINDLNGQLNKLDKLIESTAGSREAIKRRELLEKNLSDIETRLEEAELDKIDVFQKNYHRALLNDDFKEYELALSEAQAQNLIPPPISPEITRKILEDGNCICGRHIEEEQRRYIESQHHEYESKQELQYLTDGIYTYSSTLNSISDAKYLLADTLNTIVSLTKEKKEIQREIELINDNLDGISLEHDNPEARRNDIREEINRNIGARGRTNNELESDNKDLKTLDEHLKKIIDKDKTTDNLEKKRLYAAQLSDRLTEIKEAMELSIRQKLQKSVSDIFFSILPNTSFSTINIDSNYGVTLLTDNGVTYSTNNLSTGQAKTLGLSLAYGLSKDLGYSAIPLLIDNLYGDISETHFLEVTKMISVLSQEKQILIMDLNADRTRSMFTEGSIAQEFRINRVESEHKTLIEEIEG